MHSTIRENQALRVRDIATGVVSACHVHWERVDNERLVETVFSNGTQVTARSSLDFEDALVTMRARLEQKGFLLLCNRYREDAFMTSLSRQMSDGLGCYIVRWRKPVGPSRIVHSLAPAPRSKVVISADAERFIKKWKAGFEGNEFKR